MKASSLLQHFQLFFVVLTFASEFVFSAIFTDKWAVHIVGGHTEADRLASKYGFINLGEIIDGYYHFLDGRINKRSIQASNKLHHILLGKEPTVKWLEQQVSKKRVKRDYQSTDFNDPQWPIWYMKRSQGKDMNIVLAWQKGYSGKNVVVTILDDGIEKDHPDLSKNYDRTASYDVNSQDSDPSPRYDPSNENKHGTRCAGEVAAQANNKVCGVGAAFNAKIGGVRMLDGDVTDAVEAQSLSLNPQHVDIYSASWGPDDDGKTVDGPAQMAKKAFLDGVTKGRGGLGSIYVWASGNGGRQHDSCNCDGYTNSIFTLSISSVSETGGIPWYSEACSSTLATTYSSGSGKERQIVTTDLHKKCTDRHSGTSASAPLAAGICALALEANPNLTWRDMQYIVVITSRSENLNANDWATNGGGYLVSHSFGFGLMDATAIVEYAENWITVPEHHTCSQKSLSTPVAISRNGVKLTKTTSGCQGTSDEVVYLEHVQAILSLSYSRRGDLEIYLTSPHGTRSMLLPQRSRDTDDHVGFKGWPFMTTHCWGERSYGTWTLEINDKGSSKNNHGTLTEWTLVLLGTKTDPIDAFRAANKTSETIHCPMGFYTSIQAVNSSLDYQCNPCHTTCRTCTGAGPNDCTSCHFFYEQHDTSCFFIQGESEMERGSNIYYISAVVLCVTSIVLFVVIFALLQANSKGMLCWNYEPYVSLDKHNYNGLSTKEYLESDDDVYDDKEEAEQEHFTVMPK